MTGTTVDLEYELDDRYRRMAGRAYMTGVQALVRLPMMQRRRDVEAGLDTAGFVSGYRGSPLGTLDLALWDAQPFLEAHGVRFQPGINEDLAATAVWGSQQASLLADARCDGVFAMWYGKGPGVDRSCDALRHGNAAGTSPHGGVLVLAGDDPAARSSSLAHQSEHALVHCGIPVLNPASVQELLDLGMVGWAMSRHSGCWVALKCVTDVVESAAAVDVDVHRVRLTEPPPVDAPPLGLHVGWASPPLEVERRLLHRRLPAAQAFARANGVDRVVVGMQRPLRLGIVTTGKAYLDTCQALRDLGLDNDHCAQLGLGVFKVSMPWPLEPEGIRAFAAGLDAVLVVEEKRPLVEDQLARLLYDEAARPALAGKRLPHGGDLVPDTGELDAGVVAGALEEWLAVAAPDAQLPPRRPSVGVAGPAAPIVRRPAFCSGCPHNLSTTIPEGSIAQGGIGCHGMAVWMPERRTLAYTHMGGEGANWIGQSPFTDTSHIFQNLGDGTYFHSGLLAIRAAVAAGVNITYKVLANGAVAMTGGQPIEGESIDATVLVPDIARQLLAEGVAPVVVVTDRPRRFRRRHLLPREIRVRHRDELDDVQRDLREIPGVTAIVYDQTCAAEARRLRKRGRLPDPEQRVVINELVCEGCGDCSVQSNCISIEPVETELGRKRTINQHTCNKDYSCLKGYCPSFVTITGGRLRQPKVRTDESLDELVRDLPDPVTRGSSAPVNVLVAGIGGTGVVTVGALLGMAAHLEGKACSVLDVTGLAQKNGPVTSHVRIADHPDAIGSPRIGAGAADLVLANDLVVAASSENLATMATERTVVIANTHVAPTSDFATHPDLDLSGRRMQDLVRRASSRCEALDASGLASTLLGDSLAANLFLVGHALQLGLVPVDLAALEQAIALNGVKVEMNRRALTWGRLAAHDRDAIERAARPDATIPTLATSLDDIVERRVELLTAYQNARYADRYRTLVEHARALERTITGGTELSTAIARSYAKLLAYKDEYEVARLFVDGSFARQLAREFEVVPRLTFHIAPQRFVPRDPRTGRARKFALGSWFRPCLRILARLRFLRGTAFDPFGHTAHRRLERQLIVDYERTVDELLHGLTPDNHAVAVEIAGLPEHIRGFGEVKEQHLDTVRQREAQLWPRFRSPAEPEEQPVSA